MTLFRLDSSIRTAGSTSRAVADTAEAAWLAEQLAGQIIRRDLGVDCLILAVPLYNWGISQHVKTWIDLVITDPRFGSGSQTPLKGRSGLLVIARGGAYGEGTPKLGWDHSTAYLTRVLGEPAAAPAAA